VEAIEGVFGVAPKVEEGGVAFVVDKTHFDPIDKEALRLWRQLGVGGREVAAKYDALLGEKEVE